jgi:hypothetical protein
MPQRTYFGNRLPGDRGYHERVQVRLQLWGWQFLRKGIEGIFQKTQCSEQTQESSQLTRKISKKALIVKLPLKFFALVTAVILVVRYGDIDVMFFLIGLSTVFISIVLSQISFALKPADERSKQHGA